MPPNPPNALVLLPSQPLMAKVLRVVVVDLETAMMHVRRGIRAHEEGVMVHGRLPAINVRENRHVFRLRPSVLILSFASRDVQEVRGSKVEVPDVPLQLCRKVFDA